MEGHTFYFFLTNASKYIICWVKISIIAYGLCIENNGKDEMAAIFKGFHIQYITKSYNGIAVDLAPLNRQITHIWKHIPYLWVPVSAWAKCWYVGVGKTLYKGGLRAMDANEPINCMAAF